MAAPASRTPGLPRALAALGLALALVPALAQPVAGEVRKIDRAQGRLTLQHGEIKALDLPPMTMAYRVRDPAWLEHLSVGDRVRFAAEKLDGQYTITELRKP